MNSEVFAVRKVDCLIHLADMYGAYGDNNFLYPMEPKGAYGDNNLQVFAFRYFWDFQHCFAKIDSVFLELV